MHRFALNFFFTSLALLAGGVLLSCNSKKESDLQVVKTSLASPAGRSIAAFASGCFWCTEHIFEAVVGVDSAVSGYAGGTTPSPTYELVNTETTGHAETVLVYYDPKVISYEELVRVFFSSHDPTTRDRQGPDVGSSYRSILFYRTPEEKAIAEKVLKDFQPSFPNPIVTEITELKAFYRAEQYHQDYIEHHPESPYVRGVSIPRFEKFKRTYTGKLKPGS
jgi:peptide-methionine (S)-S-oxide reductase